MAPPQRVALPPPTATPVLQGPDVESADERAVSQQIEESNTGETGQIVEATFVEDERSDVINALSQGFYNANQQVAPLYSVDRYRIQFQTLNERPGNCPHPRRSLYPARRCGNGLSRLCLRRGHNGHWQQLRAAG